MDWGRFLSGRGNSNRQDAFLLKKSMSSLHHSFSHLPSISSSLSRSIPPSLTHTNETPPSCFIHPLSVFHSFRSASLPLQWIFLLPGLCFLSCLLLSLYKKRILSCFSASVTQSVCLCPCGRLAGCFAWRWRGGVTPVGDLIWWTLRGENLPLQVDPTGVSLSCFLSLFL